MKSRGGDSLRNLLTSQMSTSNQQPNIKLSSFEEELKKLQDAVLALESGDLSLEEAFARWESGCMSYATCRQILQSAKSRIESLAKNFSDSNLSKDSPVWEVFEAEHSTDD